MDPIPSSTTTAMITVEVITVEVMISEVAAMISVEVTKKRVGGIKPKLRPKEF